jgi:hypothetical protein
MARRGAPDRAGAHIRPRRGRLARLALVACLGPALLLACSKSNNPAMPGIVATGGELSGDLTAAGGQYAHLFATAGTFNYHCAIHPTCSSLAGTIVVMGAGTAVQHRVLGISQTGGSSGPYGSSCSSLSLQRDTVLVGDQVTWTINSPLPHTVTSQ